MNCRRLIIPDGRSWRARAVGALLGLCAAACAQAEDWTHPGMLRVRDLTPFGLLRLDMRAPHTVDQADGVWVIELELAYQNTYVLSENVEDYLRARPGGRRPLDAADAAVIHALPGDAYFVDGELGLFELLIHRKLDEHWNLYLTVPYLTYGQNLLDGIIEDFHEATGFSQQGRDLVARDSFQFVYDLGGRQDAELRRAAHGGLGDPVFGARYSLPDKDRKWDVVVEFAAKLAVAGSRPQLSTGRSDVGVQVGMQRTWDRHATYFAGSAVYYAGEAGTPADRGIVPTLHAAYAYALTPHTSLILQGYASHSVVRRTDVPELSDNKYQLSIGVQHRAKRVLWSVALTENISNFRNTPDVSLLFGFAWLTGGGQAAAD